MRRTGFPVADSPAAASKQVTAVFTWAVTTGRERDFEARLRATVSPLPTYAIMPFLSRLSRRFRYGNQRPARP